MVSALDYRTLPLTWRAIRCSRTRWNTWARGSPKHRRGHGRGIATRVPPDEVYCDLDGERGWNEEWGFATLRTSRALRDTAPPQRPRLVGPPRRRLGRLAGGPGPGGAASRLRAWFASAPVRQLRWRVQGCRALRIATQPAPDRREVHIRLAAAKGTHGWTTTKRVSPLSPGTAATLVLPRLPGAGAGILVLTDSAPSPSNSLDAFQAAPLRERRTHRWLALEDLSPALGTPHGSARRKSGTPGQSASLRALRCAPNRPC
jgi:hypothetical protein